MTHYALVRLPPEIEDYTRVSGGRTLDRASCTHGPKLTGKPNSTLSANFYLRNQAAANQFSHHHLNGFLVHILHRVNLFLEIEPYA
jgi:hypothetical protein